MGPIRCQAGQQPGWNLAKPGPNQGRTGRNQGQTRPPADHLSFAQQNHVEADNTSTEKGWNPPLPLKSIPEQNKAERVLLWRRASPAEVGAGGQGGGF